MTPGAGAANGTEAGAGFAVAFTYGVSAVEAVTPEEGISEDIRGLGSGFAVTVAGVFGVETDTGISTTDTGTVGCSRTADFFVAVVSTAVLGSPVVLLAQHLLDRERETLDR